MKRAATLLGRWARCRHRAVGFGLSLLTALGLYGASACLHANFHTVVPGEVYRSGQMNASQLAGVIEEYGIRSVVNLRGSNAAEWYRDETNVTGRLGVRHVDFRLSARREATDEQIGRLLAILRNAPKPVLIHCKAGADRTGLVSALYCLAIEEQSAAEAVRQLALWYGHVPLLQTIAMDRCFWHYAGRQVGRAAGARTEAP